MWILVTWIHFTRARTYYYRKLKIRVSRGHIVYRKFKLRYLLWTQNSRQGPPVPIIYGTQK